MAAPPPTSPDDPGRLAAEAVPGIHVLPVVHDRLDWAVVVRAVLDAVDPAAVAVELPTTLAAAAEAAVTRLPRISLVLSEEPGEDALVWVAAPGDPITEALRWAAERGRRRLYADPDVRYLDRHVDPMPDPYALWELGPAAFASLLAGAAGAEPASETDRLREGGLAWHTRRLRAELDAAGEARSIVLVVGAAHAARVARRLAEPVAVPLARARRAAVDLRHLHPDSLTALLPDPPLGHAAWELLRRSPPWAPEGPPLPEEPPLAATLARRLSLVSHGFRLVKREETGWATARRHRLAEHAAYRATRPGPGGLPVPDRWGLARVVWAVGSRSYREQTQEETAPWQRRLFLDFAHRHARCQGLLLPGLYELVVAARGVGDDNLAWEVFEAARSYPWQEEAAELAVVRVDGDALDLGTRRVTFRRRFFRVKQRPVAVPVRRHPQPGDPEEWLRGFTGGSLCSFPPEDLVVEDWGRYLKTRAVGLLSAERARSEPFSTSLADGVDVRETLRHLQEDRVWVRELGRAPGRAGSVVVIFDRDPGGDRFPYRMTWQGEHQDESDMAFYATDPTAQVVGPGIMRATYGGFLMTVPPGRLFDVWQDPDYRGAGEKPHVLLAAAVDYSRETLVVHVAKDAPPEPLRRYAAGQGKRIVHIPLGSLSPTTLRRVRVLHVLAGRDKRAIARDYIW